MTSPICEFLRGQIKSFVAGKGESLRWFSRQTVVDYTTIYRLTTGEQKSLSFLNASRILKVLEPSQYLSILGDYFPKETREVVASNNGDIFKKAAAMDLVLRDILTYKVFTYGSTVLDASREGVALRYGLEGIECLNYLLSIEAIEENAEGKLAGALEGELLLSIDSIKKTGAYNIEAVDLSSPGSYMQNIRANLSATGLKKWYEASVAHRNNLHAIANEEKGDIAAVASLIAAPFLREGK